MPHHHGGIIGEIEDEIVQIERMALSGGMGQGQGQGQQGAYMQQQPMSYGQGMYGAYAPPATVMPMGYAQQPAYAMRPAYAVAAPSPYGPGYVDAGDGRPAMVFGGAYEGVGAPVAAGYRQAYPPQQVAYQAQPGYPQAYAPAGQVQGLPPQGYAAAPPPQAQYAQQYPVAAQQPPPQQQPLQQQQAYAQPGQQAPPPPYAPQYPAAAGTTQPPQQAPQYAVAPGTQPLQPQNPPTLQPAAQQAYQQPAQYPQGSQAGPAQPGTQAAAQYPPASQPSPQPQYPPTSQPVAAQTAYQQAPQYPPGSQLGGQPAPQYAVASRAPGASPQPQYLPVSQPGVQPPSPQPAYVSGARDPRNTMAAIGVGAAAGGAAGLAYAAYERRNQPVQQVQQVQQVQSPAYLYPQDITVSYEPISKNVDTHHHAMKALSHSAHSAAEISAIIGTYIAAKHATDANHGFGVSGSRPEVKQYYHMMDKLEKLSADYVGKHRTSTQAWKSALGPHRRAVFAELYNSNELVRAFSQEMPGGPLALPELDSYSLGTRLTSLNFARAATRQPNLRAALSILAQVRTVVLVDDSYSMTEQGHQSWGFSRNSLDTRWNQARDLLAGIAPLVAAENPHGLDLHFLNRVPFYAGLRTSQAVLSAFNADSPNNGTPTGARVNDILDAYVATLRYYRGLKPLNLIVITDGEAQDEELLHRAIEHHVTELVHRGFPAHQFGVEFVQVGDCQYATRHLEKLEKEVSRHHHRFQRDVVGVTPANRISSMDPEGMLAIAVSGVDARMNGYMRTRGVNV